MTNVVIISGSTSNNSRLNGLEQEAIAFLNKKDVSYEQITVRELPAEDLIHAKFDSPAIIAANEKVEKSDAVIILTPVFKASYTGVLKAYLDLLPQKGFVDKSVLPLVIGGSFGHLLMIDYALKPVISSLGAETVLQGVYVLDKEIERTEDHRFFVENHVKERLDKELNRLHSLLSMKELQLK
ncbi:MULTISPECIES: NADPH-dependent FMN reductase [Cytobacillus]|uniref:NADPH-dependent FMN reductase n=1 Tax=Cytobacillus TaxID=2675230 RepID=UPI001CD2006B|nr:NADPH-dependent FMN reductase [Cytobacillus kochii]MCA1027386.1 NADPH-dependent FMN reductase [Cytobacillus kochii]MCM3322095.1 NADPH-dependent FMN reductase [Cytobacillus kochii]MCM3343073.1 NADPH-dependent FMN reductase [Cytobacillus kochii]MDM5206894.1 NADPH-dependent FMN reductase [Cytobacillus kochii]